MLACVGGLLFGEFGFEGLLAVGDEGLIAGGVQKWVAGGGDRALDRKSVV